MADINAENKMKKLTMEEIADKLEGLKSSLDIIRKTASELILGIDAQLQELQADKEVSRSLDKGEFQADDSYNTDTHVITDVKHQQEMDRKASQSMQAEPANGSADKEVQHDTSGHHVQKLDTGKVVYPAVYHQTLLYAEEQGELEEYRASRKLDKECKQAVVDEIRQNYDGKHLNKEAVNPVVEKYGSERLAFVLANTLQQLQWDGRFSRDNKAWAADFHISKDMVYDRDMNSELIVTSHPAVLDGFINVFRRDVLEREKAADIPVHKESQEKETDTLGHADQQAAAELPQEETADMIGQNEGKPEIETEPEALGQDDLKQDFKDIDDSDEIIDLGDETEQVLADMKKILNDSKNTLGHTDQRREQTEPEKAKETEFAFQIADRIVSIQETENGYDYSIMNMDYKEIEGGVYENTGVDIQEIAKDIVDDLREDLFDNGAGGSIGDDDEMIPIDYDKLMESIENAVQNADTIHKEEADNIVPEILQGNIVENFKEKTNVFFHEICEMNPSEIEETVKCHVQAQLDEAGIDAEIVDVAVAGSRCRGLERKGSDLDVIVELSTSEREDVLSDIFNVDALHIGGVKVDINPITAQRTGTLETYLPQVEDYLEGIREAREKEPVSIFNIRMNDEERWFKNTSGLDAEGLCKVYAECVKPFVEMRKYGEWIEAADHASIEQGDSLDFSLEFNEETDQITIFDGEYFKCLGLRETLFPEQAEPEVTLTVAECGEFHSFGEFYENIATVEEAIAIWKQIPPERMNGIPAIGINIHTPGTEKYDDVVTDILTGNRFELYVLDFIPEIKNNPQAMEVIAELMAKVMPVMPDMKIEGVISEDLETKLWEKRMPDLTPAEQLAVEIDRFIYNYDTNGYHDSRQSMTENVSEISEMIGQGDVEHLTEWLNEVIAAETTPEETQRANELLEKLAEYRPLAKIEEMEEQNFNMVDNILNNGAGEKAQKEENKKIQDKSTAKPSLKARLAEKKAKVAGQGHDEITKKQQREM